MSRVESEHYYKKINIAEWYMRKGREPYRFDTLTHKGALEVFDKLMRGIGMRDYVVYRGDE